jgi:hypothetical protein
MTVTDIDTSATLAELKDRAEIRDAVVLNARGVDRCDREDILASFHPGAFIDYTVFSGSPEEFCDWVLPLHLEWFVWTTHLIPNQLIRFNADLTHAVGETLVQATLRFEKYGELYDLHGGRATSPPASAADFGRYFDESEPRDGVWRMTARRAIIDSERTVRVPTENATELGSAIGFVGTRDSDDVSYEYLAKLRR